MTQPRDVLSISESFTDCWSRARPQFRAEWIGIGKNKTWETEPGQAPNLNKPALDMHRKVYIWFDRWAPGLSVELDQVHLLGSRSVCRLVRVLDKDGKNLI